MHWLSSIPLNQFLVFTLVLCRVSGLASTAPLFGAGEVPQRVRALLAFTVAALLTPSQFFSPIDLPDTLVDLALLVGRELLIGLALGFGVQLLFVSVQVSGQLISQVSGISVAEVFNPSLDAEIPVFSQLLYLFALAIFLTIGGHRLVMAGLLETFRTIPLAGGGIDPSMFRILNTLMAQSLDLGVRAAAPAATALLLATLILGLISRTMPQLNVMAMGFGINALATLGTLSLSLGAIAWAFEAEVEPFMCSLLEMFLAE